MNVYGFTDLVFNDEGGASLVVVRRDGTYVIPVVAPEPGQTTDPMSYGGNPPGVVVTQADGQKVWVFVLHGRLFATRDMNANPHALWLSWAFSRPHSNGRWQGLRRPVAKNARPPTIFEFDELVLPEEGKTASGNALLDKALRDRKMPIRPSTHKIAVFSDSMYHINSRGTYRKLDEKYDVEFVVRLMRAAA